VVEEFKFAMGTNNLHMYWLCQVPAGSLDFFARILNVEFLIVLMMRCWLRSDNRKFYRNYICKHDQSISYILRDSFLVKSLYYLSWQFSSNPSIFGFSQYI